LIMASVRLFLIFSHSCLPLSSWRMSSFTLMPDRSFVNGSSMFFFCSREWKVLLALVQTFCPVSLIYIIHFIYFSLK
jgi:hypothetical protein